ncbi:hypothetical protein H4R26_002080 [Coemansia thaxteri]|uniref:THO complex subunit 7 n=1 Tax=Coemansia thaxteri TaxID=2663907 RepID=A0A9W8BDJ0_9FUNG|nr:hypothetical protein H4R26_002080 [Coemansia thaxteri]KAJ2487956.1 hypothetical protein EV174_000193 [Coemansia sp. RSA 2320]
MATKSEEQVLRSRLIVEDRPLKRCLRQLSAICARHSHLSPEETRLACERVLQEVRWFRHTVQVATQSQRRCDLEIRAYSEQYAELERGIAESHIEIERLGDSLEESRNHKRHKVAYDEIAADANKRPTRDRLMKDFDDINAELGQLEMEKTSYEAVVGTLRAQYLVVAAELAKLGETSKNALSMQDLGIYLGDSAADADADAMDDVDCEKTAADLAADPIMGISPATPRHPRAGHDGFDAPSDNAMRDDSAAVREDGEDGGSETGYNADLSGAQQQQDTAIGTDSEEEGEYCGEDEEGELLI